MPSDTIEIIPYDPGWPGLFEAEAVRLRAALKTLALRIDHHGSTAVPGLSAKPVIDIQVSVANLEPLEAYGTPLEAIGYVHVAHADDSFCPFFHHPAQWPHTYHIHVVERGGREEQRTLAFRDYLRDHGDVAREYEALKRTLAAQSMAVDAGSRERYAEAKTSFVERIVTLAAAQGYPRDLPNLILREIQTRRANRDDAEAIAAAHRDSIRSIGPAYYPLNVVEAWGSGITPGIYVQAMDEGEAFFIAMGELDGEPAVLGFATHRVDDEQDGASVYVRGSAARKGIGTALFQLAEGHARTHGAASIHIQASLAGVEFYKANGFEELGRGEAPLLSGQSMPCVFMRKLLLPMNSDARGR